MELLKGVGVLASAPQQEVEQGEQALGVKDLGRAERAGGRRQMHVAEMQDAQAHADDRSGRLRIGKD